MRKPEWKQDGPRDQSISLLMSLAWFVEMIEVSPKMTLSQSTLDQAKIRVQDIKDLCRDYLPENW